MERLSSNYLIGYGWEFQKFSLATRNSRFRLDRLTTQNGRQLSAGYAVFSQLLKRNFQKKLPKIIHFWVKIVGSLGILADFQKVG